MPLKNKLCDLNGSHADSHSVPAHKYITLSLGGAEDFEREEVQGG